jgi:catechol 2,3-dioxygenase-like lactoylglutathione lyase family enzyme
MDGSEIVGETQPHCGCCGRQLRRDRLTELAATPGVFICAACGRWAEHRLHSRRVLRWPRLRPGRLAQFRWLPRRDHSAMTAAVPILPVLNLKRSEDFYAHLGFTATFHHPEYLIMRTGQAELHFGLRADVTPTSCYLDVRDARRLWKEWRSRGIEGLGPVEEFDYGMREFVVTDPDGNRLRVGSPISD